MTSFIDRAMEVPEEQVAPEGEYDLRIRAARNQRTKNDDRDMLVLGIGIEAPEDYQMFSEFITLPNDDDWENEDGRLAKLFTRSAKRVLAVFGLTLEDVFTEGTTTADVDVPIGCAGRCLVKQDMFEGRPVNKLQPPRLKE